MKRASTSWVPEVTVDELRRSLEEDRSVRILDVRPREKYEEWHIPGSQHVGGYQRLKQGDDNVFSDVSIPDKEPLVTVCGAGKTSKTAARLLREQGKDAYSLRGGMRNWSFAWNEATIRFPEARANVVQLRRTGKGCLSYLVGSENEALVIDPALPPDLYERQAERRNWKITGVLDTHIHADHLSRARRLAESTGAQLYLPKEDRSESPHQSLKDGETLEVGTASLTAHHTPGHTPESMTYELGKSALFTGDTLFLQGVGRPDLDAKREEGREKAHQLYRSLQRLTRLPDERRVLPGHYSQPIPFDGTVLESSLERVKQKVDALHWEEQQFVERILDRVPPTPPNHETIITHNESGKWPVDADVVDLEAGANRCAVG